MKEVKRWQIQQNSIGEDDFKWAIGLGCRLQVTHKKIPIDNYGGTPFHVAGAMHITVVTETAKQEQMMQLKYPNMYLLTRTFVQEGTLCNDGFGWLD